jgi:predicted alpha/beta hydrolase
MLERLKVQFMWYTVLPVLTRWKGYSPWRMLGIGEDLPQGVFWRWRHWCKFPNYFFGDPEMTGIADEFARVRTPIAAANALDDLWALPRSRNAFIGAYRNAPVELIDVDPREVGGIGHMGYFRNNAQPLWDAALNWLKKV